MSTSRERGQGHPDVSLREYMQAQIDALAQIVDERDRQYTERWEVSQKALTTALVATDKRFDTVNEFRAQLADLIRTFMPRTEADARLQALDERLSAIVVSYESKLDLIRADIKSLRESRSAQTGSTENQQTTNTDLRAWASVALSAIAVVASIWAITHAATK